MTVEEIMKLVDQYGTAVADESGALETGGPEAWRTTGEKRKAARSAIETALRDLTKETTTP